MTMLLPWLNGLCFGRLAGLPTSSREGIRKFLGVRLSASNTVIWRPGTSASRHHLTVLVDGSIPWLKSQTLRRFDLRMLMALGVATIFMEPNSCGIADRKHGLRGAICEAPAGVREPEPVVELADGGRSCDRRDPVSCAVATEDRRV
jgi:hypothetical protein